MKQFLHPHIFLHFNLGLFELIDLVVNPAERVGAVGSIIFSAGLRGDGLQRVLVNIDRNGNQPFLPREWIDLRKGRHPVSAHANRIDLDLQRLGYFCRSQRRHFSGIVLAIGH